MTSWVWVDWVWIGCCWAVPPDDVSCLIEWETVVLVVDVVIIKVVLEVGCITAHENVTKIVWACCTAKFWVEPVVNSVVVLVEWSKAVIIEILIVIDFTIEACLAVCVSTGRLVRSIVFQRIVAKTVTVVVDVDTSVRDSVVVIVWVKHVEDAIVVVIGIGRIWCSIVVVVRIDEVWNAIAVKVTVNNVCERRCSLCTLRTRPLSIRAYSSCFPSDVVDTTGVISVIDEVPDNRCIKEVAGCSIAGCDRSIVWMGIIDVCNVVVVVVWVEVIHEAIRIVVARPCELVDSSVVVVVFIEASCSRTIAVFIGNTVVVVVEWVLVCKIECADCSVSPWVNSGRDDKAVGRYI